MIILLLTILSGTAFASNYNGEQSHSVLYTDLISGKSSSNVVMDDPVTVQTIGGNNLVNLVDAQGNGETLGLYVGGLAGACAYPPCFGGSIGMMDEVSDFRFFTHAIDRMTITADTGYVGINILNPSSTLHVNGTAVFRAKTPVTAGFRVENVTGARVFTVDQANGRVSIGGLLPTTALHIQRNGDPNVGLIKLVPIYTDAGGITFWPRQSPTDPEARSWQVAANYNYNGSFDILRSSGPTGNPVNSVLTINNIGNVGIGVYPAQKLDVAGTVNMNGFKMPTNAVNGYVLTSDETGVGTWQPSSTSGISGSGDIDYIPKFTYYNEIGNSMIYDDGSGIGIGTNSLMDYPAPRLEIMGSANDNTYLTITPESGSLKTSNILMRGTYLDGNQFTAGLIRGGWDGGEFAQYLSLGVFAPMGSCQDQGNNLPCTELEITYQYTHVYNQLYAHALVSAMNGLSVANSASISGGATITGLTRIPYQASGTWGLQIGDSLRQKQTTELRVCEIGSQTCYGRYINTTGKGIRGNDRDKTKFCYEDPIMYTVSCRNVYAAGKGCVGYGPGAVVTATRDGSSYYTDNTCGASGGTEFVLMDYGTTPHRDPSQIVCVQSTPSTYLQPRSMFRPYPAGGCVQILDHCEGSSCLAGIVVPATDEYIQVLELR